MIAKRSGIDQEKTEACLKYELARLTPGVLKAHRQERSQFLAQKLDEHWIRFLRRRAASTENFAGRKHS